MIFFLIQIQIAIFLSIVKEQIIRSIRSDLEQLFWKGELPPRDFQRLKVCGWEGYLIVEFLHLSGFFTYLVKWRSKYVTDSEI